MSRVFFISHRHEDKKIADVIERSLREWNVPKNDIFYSSAIYGDQKPELGAPLHPEVCKAAYEAKLFILIYTLGTEDWAWCMHELGLAIDARAVADGKGTDTQIIIMQCMQDEPKLFRELKRITIGFDNLRDFVSTVLCKYPSKDKPYWQELSDDILDKFTANLYAELQSVIPTERAEEYKPYRLHKYFVLEIKDASQIAKTACLPGDARVEIGPKSLDLFNLSGFQTPETWRELEKDCLPDPNARWIRQIAEALFEANAGRDLTPVRSMFRAQSGKLYLPVLHDTSRTPNGSVRFSIIFIEQLTAGILPGADKNRATLLSCITLGSRLEWEVCRYYLGRVERWRNSSKEIRKGYQQIRESIANIERESEYRKEEEIPGETDTEDRLTDVFMDEPDIMIQVQNNLESQRKYKKQLIKQDDEINEDDLSVEKIRNALTQLRKLNLFITKVVARRYADELEKDYKKSQGNAQA
jgi:hypothetical protein